MAIEKMELEVAKEIRDVAVLLKKVVQVIKEKGDYASLLGEFITAVSGLDQVDDEIKANLEVALATMGYELAQIPAILIGKKA